MGVERAVTRWYVQRHALLEEIAALEVVLAQKGTEASSEHSPGEQNVSEASETAKLLTRAREKLHSLGPCPTPMMG